MTRVKICGITNLRDALLAAEYDADAVGFNFFKGSPRYIDPAGAGGISHRLPSGVLKVGVFVDEAPETIEAVARTALLDAVQLHGDEPAELAADISRRTGLQVIKAFRVADHFDVEGMKSYRADAFLLDAWSPGEYGGTGERFDWTVARRARECVSRLYLAGGLNPGNVADAINAVGPYCVDACSGLESAKGIKDAEKVRLFIERAKLQ